jgi:glycopeptide antibiotics resistance protein
MYLIFSSRSVGRPDFRHVPLVRMPSHRIDIPALPVLLPLGAVLMVVSWWTLRRRGTLTTPRLLTAWVAGWYPVAVLGATFLPLHLAWGPGTGPPDRFRIILVPLVTMRPDDFVLNTAMMLPLAALLRLVFGVRGVARAVGAGFLISFGIEATQAVLDLTLHGDRWADVNDLTSNTLGALLGALLLGRALRSAAVRHGVEQCTLARSGPVRNANAAAVCH